ncbi:MAG: hypothetical protein M1819_001980 [Sarea resinae]|nr:MAG: hypothetical protein M1819_001980 [Sarea resinae]
MAGSSFSSTTTTSHTLSADPCQPPPTDLHPASTQALVSTLSGAPHTFLQPPPSLHSAALVLAKRYLDPLASSVSQAQLQRQRESRKKRKRGEDDDVGQLLQFNRLYLDGFGTPQVWEQARRVIDATREEVQRDLSQISMSKGAQDKITNGQSSEQADVRMIRFGEDGFEESSSGEDSLGEEGVDWEYDGEDTARGEGFDGEEDESAEEDEEDDASADEHDDLEMDNSDFDNGSEAEEAEEAFLPDKHGLNDGFFSIDDFNKQSEFLEQQDAAGDPNDGGASDEEDIDWDADPMSSKPDRTADGKVNQDGGEDEDEDEEDGPTFGNADLYAPEGASDDEVEDIDEVGEEMDAAHGGDNTNEVYYTDFFAPPPRKAGKKSRKPKTAKAPMPEKENNEENLQRTMSAVRRDLFEDDLSADEEDSAAELGASDPKSRRSTHERRQAKIKEEIRKLEAANVAKRDWTLSGEARAADRPMNSLLEEDLDFERTGKPVPVITTEVSEDIEALIKRRILNQEFDEVIRRRPDSLATPEVRRGRFELDDTKPQQSLAELYEQDHLKATDPSYLDQRDEKLKKQHAEIEALWRDVSAKLDALSSWHYRPKPPAPSMNVVADVATISMEDARPTAGGEVGGASMLAPQEVYAPGKETAGAGEVVPKSGIPVNREEMTREEKLRRRRREKVRIHKRGLTATPGRAESKKGKERKEVVSDLKKGGVKVIGRKGEIRDVEGKKIKPQQAGFGGGGFKL